MQKQSGACAFSNACIVPGPRERVPGTINRFVCHVHSLALALPLAAPSAEPFGHAAVRKPQGMRRGRWI
jgi:hypothetical protein